jgi:hypothetical protein
VNFAHPAVLFGLVLGSIPIIVYYLMRFRSLRLPWGADYILERALARRRQKLYLDQIILLALRALVVMALVTAFARPLGKTLTGDTGGELLRIVVVARYGLTGAGRAFYPGIGKAHGVDETTLHLHDAGVRVPRSGGQAQ